MTDIYLLQLVGVALATTGTVTLMASIRLFGTRESPAEKRLSSDEWNRRADKYRAPISLETFVSLLLLSGGVAILIWWQFNPCEFLEYWLPSLPKAVKLFLSCR